MSVTEVGNKQAARTGHGSMGRLSDCSDGFSSEGYSSESNHPSVELIHTSPHVGRERSYEKAPKPANKSKQGQSKKGPEARPLCLDYLNGTCSQLRSYCRYYHPKPHEAAAHALATSVEESTTSPTRTPGPICEVWALTGFCKFGQKCWKEHPKCTDLQLEQSVVAEPVTKKFQEWLQSRAQGVMSPERRNGSVTDRRASPARSPGTPVRSDSWNRSAVTSPTRLPPAPAFSAQEFAQAQELLMRLECFNEVVPNLVQLLKSGRLTMHSLMPMLQSTAVRSTIPSSLFARCAALLRDEFPADGGKCEQLLCSLVQSMAVNALNNFFPKSLEDYQSCLKNASFLGDLFLVGIAKEKEMDEFLQLLLQNFEKHSFDRQDLRVQMLCQVLTTTGYHVKPTEYRRIQSLTQEVRSPQTLRSLWTLLGTIPPPAPLAVVSVGRPMSSESPSEWDNTISQPESPVDLQVPENECAELNHSCSSEEQKQDVFVHQPYVFA